MKKLARKFLLGIAAAMLTAGVAGAADLKIGVVNATRLIEDAPQAQLARDRMEKEFAQREKELTDEQKALKRLEDKLARDAAIMSENESRKMERDIVARRRELRRKLDELREDRSFRGNEERAKVYGYVNAAIKAVGKEEGFDLILYEGIAFANPAIDVTSKILERLKAENNAGGK